MSTDKRKVHVGLLPEQTEDYSQYEESELNWGRIIPAAILVVVIVIFSMYSLLESEEAPTNKIEPVSNTEQILNNATTKNSVASAPDKVQSPVKTAEPVTKATIKEDSSLINKVNVKLVESVHKNKPRPHQKSPGTPVKILDAHIKKAQLSSNLIKGIPVDSLSPQVLMSEEGIIRVHLYTEMENLRGQNLFHYWYLNGEKQARVRVPINHDHQRSSSSKFINKQMLGKWSVQVLDDQGKAYIEVNFEVISP